MCTTSCLDFVARSITADDVRGRSVLEVGALDVNGSARPLLEALGPCSYLGVDLRSGPGVDQQCDACELLARFGPESFDVVVSTEMLEHVREWQLAVTNMKAVLRPGGQLLLTTRAPGFPYHGYPEDYWRFDEDDMRGIFADLQDLSIQADWEAPGVFVKATKPSSYRPADLSHTAVLSILTDQREASLQAVIATLTIKLGPASRD